jgi:carboxypeptidase T
LLISQKPGVNHLLYDEVAQLVTDILANFGDIVELESIGKTFEGRDIFMLKIDATGDNDKKAILLTGAHHSRELVSVQMPLFTILDLLHGLVHRNPEKMMLLEQNKYFVIPVVNVDGFYTIYEEYMKTGELVLKRKNNDRRFEKEECPLATQGVDLNRNYGYLWGNKEGPCSEAYPGPHAFSEPETKAMRSMLYKYNDTIKMVYNFHAYGPMYVWPYNGQLENQLEEENPDAQAIFNEIWDGATFPSTTLRGNAIKTVGYKADGECNDYIMKQFNIPSVSPELGNDDFFSN